VQRARVNSICGGYLTGVDADMVKDFVRHDVATSGRRLLRRRPLLWVKGLQRVGYCRALSKSRYRLGPASGRVQLALDNQQTLLLRTSDA
jgi:hypothetical protein